MLSAFLRNAIPRRQPRHILLDDESVRETDSSSFLGVLSELCGHFIKVLEIIIPGGIWKGAVWIQPHAIASGILFDYNSLPFACWFVNIHPECNGILL